MANKRGARVNLDKQEDVVSVLWEFASNLQHKPNEGCVAMHESDIHFEGQSPKIATALPGTKASLEHVGTALEKIMKTFGYNVASIQ